MKISENCYKLENTANPISPNVFCADPTGVEYNGRLYIYGLLLQFCRGGQEAFEYTAFFHTARDCRKGQKENGQTGGMGNNRTKCIPDRKIVTENGEEPAT